ncbi:argininosuccinate lyase [Mangrovivirga sp. M17]|uniref:Argininosuccinate lyase n=1 Tax=Mangrovivirga halotolerans TaxID=2993936 RepID=A0ABT3RP69_9BACT|nr:argininosuccinate lyase [Mangrovivirga halotolerans]MCX2743582.1 argininosuccinate lyase [Mangrovivirga halotolerans]
MNSLNKLWSKGKPLSEKIEAFTIGRDLEFDKILAKYDVIGSKAHATMLAQTGLIEKEEGESLIKELEDIYQIVILEDFEIPEGFEDVHSWIEAVLTERLGDTGKRIHTARSRNDQVLTDLHLFCKDSLNGLISQVENIALLLVDQGEKYNEVILPGYTHLQVAMPSSGGMWFSAYAEALADDLIMLQAALKVADQNPLGSAAGYGSSFPIDRDITTKEMGFTQMKVNSFAAQLNRGKLEKTITNTIASIAQTLGRFSMDVCLYNSQNFGFISLPDELTTGSSIMPHKKNPDVFELIRGKCNLLQGVPFQVTSLTNNLPGGYHREYQLLKELLFPAINDMVSILDILEFAVSQMKLHGPDTDEEKYKLMYTVEAVNAEVMKGKPFREAYKIVGQQVESGEFQIKPGEQKYTHIGSIGNPGFDEIRKKITTTGD